MRVRTLAGAAALAILATGVAAAEKEPMPWYEATERLQLERDAAVTCARIIKRHLPEGDAAALSRAELSYAAARREVMAVIARLDAALIDKQEEAALTTVEDRLERGRAAREALCDKAEAMIPPDTDGQKRLPEAVISLAETLIDAGVTIWKEIRDADEVRRANLRTALEDAKWPAFKDIEP